MIIGDVGRWFFLTFSSMFHFSSWRWSPKSEAYNTLDFWDGSLKTIAVWLELTAVTLGQIDEGLQENVVSFNVAIGDSTPLAATWLNFGHIPVWTKAAQFLFQIFKVLDGLWRPTDSVLMLS